MPVQVEISPAAHAKIEEQSTDELLDDLVQETVTRSEQEVKEQKPHYDDLSIIHTHIRRLLSTQRYLYRLISVECPFMRHKTT